MNISKKAHANRTRGFNHKNRRGFHGKPACMKRPANQYAIYNSNDRFSIQENYEPRNF